MSRPLQSPFTSDMRELGLQQTPEFFDAWRHVSSRTGQPSRGDDFSSPLEKVLKAYSERVIARSDPSKRRMLVLGGSNRPTRPSKRYGQTHFYHRDPHIYVDAQTFDQTFIINKSFGLASLTVPEIIVKIGQRDYPVKGLAADFNDIQTWRTFPDNFFDLIVFDLSTIWYFKPTNKLLIEIIRTLKPRGYFYIPSIEDSTHVNAPEIRDSLKRIQKEEDETTILFQRNIKGMPFYRDTPGVRGGFQSVVRYCDNDAYIRLSKNNFINRFIKKVREKTSGWRGSAQAPTREQVDQSLLRGKYAIAHLKAKSLPEGPRETTEKRLFEIDTRLTREALKSAFQQQIKSLQDEQHDQMQRGPLEGINQRLRRYVSEERKKYIRMLKQRLDQIRQQERRQEQII